LAASDLSNGTTGTGTVVLAAAPTLTGNTTVGTINKLTITAPATGSTLAIADGKTLTVSKTMTLTSADDTSVITLPSGTKTLVAADAQFYIGSTAISHNQGTGTLTLPNSALTSSSVTIGSTAISLGGTVTSFTGLTALSSAAATGLSVSTGTTGALTLDSGTTGAINIGTNANAKTITLGNTGVATAYVLDGTGGVKISNTAAETSATYASMTGALRVAGGIGAGGNSFFAGSLAISTSLTINGTPSVTAGVIANTAAVFNTSTGTVNIGGAATTVNIGKAAGATVLASTLQHAGLVMTTGTSIDQTKTFATSAFGLDNSIWTNTGITGATQLATGVYQGTLQVAATGEYYAFTLPWYSANGNATLLDDFTEIPLQKYGDGGTGTSIFMRIFRTASAAPVLQLIASAAITTSSIHNFSFRRIM
jgi:hypothetical protein